MDREKYVDESWKESAQKEKELLSQQNPSAGTAKPHSAPSEEKFEHKDSPQEQSRHDEPADSSAVSFLNYVSSLAYQAMMFLGLIPHPETGEQMEADAEQAKLFIDTLIMLRQKTKGNLSKKEEDMLNASIYELQMRFVEATGKAGKKP